MKKQIALLLAATMVLSLAACSKETSDTPAATTAQAGENTGSTESGEKKVLRYGGTNANVGYDAQTNTNSGATTIEECVVEGLYRWNDDNVEVPVLAKDFPEISEDGLVYTFHLQEGVKFSDGTDLTSEDVKFTFERMFTPATGATSTYMYTMIKGAQEMLDGTATELEGFEIVDDYTFNITLKQPFACFTQNLGIIYASIYPSEACSEAGANWGVTTLIGTGQYILDWNETDTTHVTLNKNENYWGQTPNFDQIIVKYYDDNNTKLLAFENGDIDICQVTAALYLQYQGSDIEQYFHTYVPLGTIFLSINLSEQYNGEANPLADVNCRKAISYAINRQELIDSYLNGLGSVATSTINPSELGYKEREPYEYNVEKAKECLAQSAYPNGFSFTAEIRSQDEGEMTVIQAYLAAVGIDMKINVVDAAVWSADRTAGATQCQWMGWFPLYADADNNIYSYFHSSNAKGKSVFYNNPVFDELMDKARLSTDSAERQSLYEQADEIMSLEDYACIPLYYPNYVFAAREYVTGFNVGNLIYNLPYDVAFTN